MSSFGLDRMAAAAIAASAPVTVPFKGAQFRVKPPIEWRQSAMEALNVGNFNGWARSALVNDLQVAEDGSSSGSNDVQKFVVADLTMGECLEFVQAYAQAAGQAPGESQASPSS